MISKKLYINGEYVDSSTNEFIEVENPATEEIFAKVSKAGLDDAKKAVESADEAFKTYKDTSLDERISYIEDFKKFMEENSQRFLDTMRVELGVPEYFSKSAHFEKQIDRIDNFIDQAKKLDREIKMKDGFVRYEPVGVVSAITPWNYPLGQIIQKVIPALLTGNTVVLKPASITPLTAHLLVEGFDKAGLPKGVLNLITGEGSELGEVINKDPRIKKVSFTGSTSGGIAVGKDSLDTVKLLTLELGGKSPAAFIDDSQIEKGVDTVLDSIFLNTGQTCSALSRIVVLDKIKEKLIDRLIDKAKTYKVGDPKDKDTMIGPLSSKDQYDKVRKYIKLGLDEGAEIIFGNLDKKSDKGYFVSPIIFDKVDRSMKIHKDEIFGPVLAIETVSSIDELVEVSNDVDYGLSAAVFGKKDKALEVAKQIKAGQVIVNGASGDINLPFGGYKMSGLGREGGSFGLREYLEVKSIHISD